MLILMIYKRRTHVVPPLFGCLLLTFSLGLHAQTIRVFTGTGQDFLDQAIYTGSTSFVVPTDPGHNYLVQLDGNQVLPGYTNQVTQADYHELFISRVNVTTSDVAQRMIRFIVRASDRGDTETGLPAWVPYPTIPSSTEELAGAQIDLILPEAYPQGMEIPVVAWIRNDQGDVVRANGTMTAEDDPSVVIRRGVGSGFLADNHAAGTLAYVAQMGSIQATKNIQIQAGTVWNPVSGTLSGNQIWTQNARISVTGSITIPAGSSLTIQEGVVVRLNAGVNITNLGRINILGKKERPVVFTPITRAQPWGGFFLTAATSQFDASGAIFVAACAQQSGYPGHRSEQPLLYIDNRARAAMTNCAAIYLAGQFQHSIDRSTPYATVAVVDTLIQRCTTAGEFNGCSLTLLGSALVEVPNEDQFYCSNPDCDHDGFYLNAGVHEIRDSLIGWLKDDCFDAGSGGGPSTVTVSNCWVEGAFHEALAWSGGSRTTRTYDTVLINNGQGIECGWSSGANSPVVYGTRLLSLANAVGARYGDNYTGTSGLGLKNGTLNLSNSIVVHNLRDVFGRVWDNTWNYRVGNMNVADNLLSAPNPFHPNNALWNPAADAWQLSRFMTTPPGASVGIGVAAWGSTFTMAAIFQGVPVRLSSFTTNTVTVDYAFRSGATTLAGGTLAFAPGETVKRIYPVGFNAAGQATLTLVLSNPVHGQLTGGTSVTFLGTVPSPLVACRVLGTQMDLARIGEGLPVGLSTPAAQTVSVDYKLESDNAILANGTAQLEAGQTVLWVQIAGVSPQDHQLLRFQLSNPLNAQLGSPSTVYLVKAAPNALPPSATLIAPNAVWRYRDLASTAPAGWQNLGFDDSTWLSGPAQLGFSGGEEADEATLIADNNQITSYFRHSFNVAKASDYASLTMNMVRDDGGVVYLNGTELLRSPNLPAPPTAIVYATTTSGDNGENTPESATVNASALRDNANVVAVEMHQQSATSSDVSFQLELIGNAAPLPPPPQFVYLATFDGQPVLAWSDPAFRLQRADTITGQWITDLSVTSPFFIVPTGEQEFYRLTK